MQSMEDFPSAESEEIARKPTKPLCKSQWQFHECFMNHPGLTRGGGLHKALLRACFRCHFGYKRDFHEDITPRGIHTRCIKATNLFSFAMENSAASLRKAAPHMPRSMIIMIACGLKRMKSVLKFIVAINPSSQKFHLWRAIFLLSRASLAPNSGFIAIVKTQWCLVHNFWAHNLVNVHRTCSPLLTRLQRTVNEPQPKMIKINYCWAWFVVDGNHRRFLDKPFSCFPQYSVEAKPKIYIFHCLSSIKFKFLWRHKPTRPILNRRQQNRRLLTSLWPYFVMCHRKHNFPLCMNDIPALGDCRRQQMGREGKRAPRHYCSL